MKFDTIKRIRTRSDEIKKKITHCFYFFKGGMFFKVKEREKRRETKHHRNSIEHKKIACATPPWREQPDASKITLKYGVKPLGGATCTSVSHARK